MSKCQRQAFGVNLRIFPRCACCPLTKRLLTLTLLAFFATRFPTFNKCELLSCSRSVVGTPMTSTTVSEVVSECCKRYVSLECRNAWKRCADATDNSTCCIAESVFWHTEIPRRRLAAMLDLSISSSSPCIWGTTPDARI